MKLISSTNLILKQMGETKTSCDSSASTTIPLWRHAHFVKQTSELWMYIPCYFNGSEWVPFKSPDKPLDTDLYANVENPITNRWKEFQRAKQRILFEGFKGHQRDDRYTHMNWTKHIESGNGLPLHDITIIEDAIKVAEKAGIDLVLTPTAQKQIGL